MRVIVQDTYGAPDDVLEPRDIDTPVVPKVRCCVPSAVG
jgi:hypothetical protein